MKRTFLIFCIIQSSLWLYGQTQTEDNTVRFVNYGKMNVTENPAGQNKTTLYIPQSLSVIGNSVSILQDGISTLGGNFNNDVTVNNVFDASSTGTFRFYGTIAVQNIQGTANRNNSYINFPNVEVDKLAGYVKEASFMGMNSDNLLLTMGKLQLDSKLADQGVDHQTQVANLLVNGTVTYNTTVEDRKQKGVVEILLALPSEQTERQFNFIAFSSPYKTMYADYFSYWMLGAPTNTGLFGDTKTAISDPTYALTSGRGHVVGQDVFEDDVEYYQNQPIYSGSSFNDRATSLLTLNRWADPFYGSTVNVAQKTGKITTAYIEEIQTADVLISLKAGYNYLGNPYTVPLDISKLLEKETDVVNDPWKITRSQEDGRDDQLFAAVWVMDQMSSKITNALQHKFTVNATWSIAQKSGSTYTRNGDIPSIAPMQTFVVWAEKDATITIPKSERKHGNINFLRNADNGPVDELLLEVVDADTKAYDRMCVVFRPDASMKAGDPYDAYKRFNNSGTLSQIYNRSADGYDMMVNVIPSTQDSMLVSLTPANQFKEVTLSAYRLNSLVSPQGVWLKDLKTENYIDLAAEEFYTFNTEPNDTKDRFVLYFTNKYSTDDYRIELSPLHAVYYNSLLSVSGITTQDAGSSLGIYDMQGRVVHRSDLPETSRYTFSLQLQPGAYIVKITGKRSLTTKILAK